MTSTIAPRIAGVLTVATAAVAFLPGPASVAAPGDLDPTFGTGGVAVVDEGVAEYAAGLTVQPDGKIIGVGATYLGGSGDALVFRLNPDGSRDAGFGYRQLDGPGGVTDTAAAVAVQPDGKIVVVGRTFKNYDGAVWRLLPTGEIDPSFGGGDGLATIDSLAEEYLNDVAIAPDGRIVVVGRTTRRGALLRSTGSPPLASSTTRSTPTASSASAAPTASPPESPSSPTTRSSSPGASRRRARA